MRGCGPWRARRAAPTLDGLAAGRGAPGAGSSTELKRALPCPVEVAGVATQETTVSWNPRKT